MIINELKTFKTIFSFFFQLDFLRQINQKNCFSLESLILLQF